MKRFIQGEHQGQSTLLPESLDDYVSDTNPVRVVDVFVDELDLAKLGFDGVIPAETGRPAYHPAILLKIYIYGYLNRIQSSRRLEREAHRNVELMWLAGPHLVGCADISGRGGEGGVMAFMARLGLLLNCVSEADQASDRSPEEEISDSSPGIGIHPGGKRR